MGVNSILIYPEFQECTGLDVVCSVVCSVVFCFLCGGSGRPPPGVVLWGPLAFCVYKFNIGAANMRLGYY